MLGDKKKTETKLQPVWTAVVPDHVVGVAWSSNGSQVAAAAVNGPVVVYEAASGRILFDLSGHDFGTAALAFHPADPLLATAGQDGKIRLWGTILGQKRAAFDGGAAWVEKLAWSPDGKQLASAAGKKVRIWELATGDMLREYTAHPATIADIAWQPKSSILAVAVYGGVLLYDVISDDPPRHFEWKGSPLKLAWSPNGKLLAHGNQDATVHFWYADTGLDLQMSGYPTKIRELAWDFASRTLATGGGEMVCVWDCGGKGPAGTTPKMFEAHKKPVSTLAFQRRGFLLASGGQDGRLCLWQPANRTPLLAGVTFEETEITDLAWSPDDRSMLVGSANGGVGLFKVV